MHTMLHIRRAMSCHSSLGFEIYQTSIERMKAETLSWSSGFPSARGRIRPQDVAKIVQTSDMAKENCIFFFGHARVPEVRQNPSAGPSGLG